MDKSFDGENVVSISQKFSIRKQALWNGLISVSIVVNEKVNYYLFQILLKLVFPLVKK